MNVLMPAAGMAVTVAPTVSLKGLDGYGRITISNTNARRLCIRADALRVRQGSQLTFFYSRLVHLRPRGTVSDTADVPSCRGA